MSDQLTNTGLSGLLAMLGAAPTSPGPGAGVAPGSGLPFGSILQAQGADFNLPQLNTNGQPLPQLGGMLPPAGDPLAPMGGAIDVEARAPELSQLRPESALADLLLPALNDSQTRRDGLVLEQQWPGVTPPKSELSLESPEVVALMQNAFEGHADAEQRLSVAVESLQIQSPQNSQTEPDLAQRVGLSLQLPSGVQREASDMRMPVVDGDSLVRVDVESVDVKRDNASAPELTLELVDEQDKTVPGAEVRISAVAGLSDPEVPRDTGDAAAHPMRPVNTAPVDQGTARVEVSSQSVASVTPWQQEPEPQVTQSVTVPAAAPLTGQNPVVDSQNAAPVVAAVLQDGQASKAVDSGRRASVGDNVQAAASGSRESIPGGPVVTQIATTGAASTQTSPVVPSPVNPEALPVEGKAGVTLDVDDLTRSERGDASASTSTADDAEGWSRAESRVAAQASASADNSPRMTPSQAAFTLAGKGQMGTPAWNQALSERVMVMTAQNNQVAEIQLDPPELGALKVRLQVGQDQVSVTFTSPHAAVRDAVEQGMPRLREMMEEQGLNLGESSVNDQSSESDDEGRQRFASQGGDDKSASAEQAVSAPVSGEAVSLVDYYA